MTQYIIILINAPLLIPNTYPAIRPLTARITLGVCPISTLPSACTSVTALSSVENIQVISATIIMSVMPAAF